MRRRDVRAIAAGATIILASWLGIHGFPQAAGWLEIRELEVQGLAQEVAHGRRVRIDTHRLADSIGQMEEVAAALPQVLLLGEDARTAGFDLTRRLTALLSNLPVFIQSIQATEENPTGGPLGKAAVMLTLQSDLTGVLRSLEIIEANPSLGVDSLRIYATDPSSSPTEQERLHVQAAVSGWYRQADDASSSQPAPP